MGYCVEISSTAAISNPEPFLTRCLKAGVITLTLCTQGIDTLKMQAFPVNGKSVVCWNGLIPGTAPVFFPLFQFLWLQGHAPVLDWRKGQQNFCRVRLLSVVLPSLCIASPASQIKLPAGRALLLELRFLRGIKASPS